MEIFINHQWLGFFDLLKGFDEDLAQEFAVVVQSHSEERSTTMVRGLSITLSPELISVVITFPLGVKWVKERMPRNVAKKIFFMLVEECIEDNNGVREILPYPWDELAFHIMKLISCEGRLSVVYGYHLRLLNEVRFHGEIPLE